MDVVSPTPGMENSFALVIGIADYPTQLSLPPVVVNDAAVVYRLLVDPKFCGYPPENVRILVNEQATKTAILAALAELGKRVSPDATVLIYFSGHAGSLNPSPESVMYMIPVDADLRDLERTGISNQEFSKALGVIPAQHTVSIIDSCYAGSFLESLTGLRNEVLLASSKADELSFVSSGRSNSVFTGYLIEGLRGELPSTDGYIRIFDLFEYVHARVTGEQPLQHPIIKGSTSENFPIALYLGGQQGNRASEDAEILRSTAPEEPRSVTEPVEAAPAESASGAAQQSPDPPLSVVARSSQLEHSPHGPEREHSPSTVVTPSTTTPPSLPPSRETIVQRVNLIRKRLAADPELQRRGYSFTRQIEKELEEAQIDIDSEYWEDVDEKLKTAEGHLVRWRKSRREWVTQLERLAILEKDLISPGPGEEDSAFLRRINNDFNNVIQNALLDDSPQTLAKIFEEFHNALRDYRSLAKKLYAAIDSLANPPEKDRSQYTAWRSQLSDLVQRMEQLPWFASSEFYGIAQKHNQIQAERRHYEQLNAEEAESPMPEQSAAGTTEHEQIDENQQRTIVERRLYLVDQQLTEDHRLSSTLGEPFSLPIRAHVDRARKAFAAGDSTTLEQSLIAAEALLAKWRAERLEWIEQLEYQQELQKRLESESIPKQSPHLGEIYDAVQNAPRHASEYASATDFRMRLNTLYEQVEAYEKLKAVLTQLGSLTDQIPDDAVRNKLQQQIDDFAWNHDHLLRPLSDSDFAIKRQRLIERIVQTRENLIDFTKPTSAARQGLRELLEQTRSSVEGLTASIPSVDVTTRPAAVSPSGPADIASQPSAVFEAKKPSFIQEKVPREEAIQTGMTGNDLLESTPAPKSQRSTAEPGLEAAVTANEDSEGVVPAPARPEPDRTIPAMYPPADDRPDVQRDGATVVTNVFVGTRLPTPPRDEDRITIEVNDDDVILRLNDDDKDEYRSPNRLDYEALNNAEISVRDIGRLLFQGIIHDTGRSPDFTTRPTRTGYLLAQERARLGLRIGLRIAPGSHAYGHQWELLCGRQDDAPLSVDERHPLYRLHSVTNKPAVEAKPIRFLFAICNPRSLGPDSRDPNLRSLQPLNVQLERNIIAQAMESLVKNGLAAYEIISGEETPVTLAALQAKLQDKWHVLHLLAHGGFIIPRNATDTGEYKLIFENQARNHEYISAPDFNAAMFKSDLRLIVLAACQSGNLNQDRAHEKGEAFRTLAPLLVEKGVPAVIAMQQDLTLSAAQVFTQRFYGDLARSGRIDMALAATRHDLWTLDRESSTWAIPMLVMGQHDAKLFNVDEQLASSVHRPAADELPVRDYKELGGNDDPAAVRLAQALEKQVQDHGFGTNAGLINALRGVIAPSLVSRARNAEPLAPRQDRTGLTAQLATPLDIDAGALKRYVLDHSGVELFDTTYAQIAAALNAGKHIILIGPPGTGKTSLAQDICAFAAREGESTHFTPGGLLATATADWTTFDTVGGYVPTQDQTLQFRPGMFLRAVYTGQWLIIDEINRADIDKAFGELFTVLSGQAVTLPYMVGNEIVRVLPAEQWSTDNTRLGRYDYVIHPCWRIIGTMNVYDKSSLYAMSFAFMRRFAFIDTDLPDNRTVYFRLVDTWLSKGGLPVALPGQGSAEVEERDLKILQQKFRTLLDRNSALMQRRALGPAIIKDMIHYISNRYRSEQDEIKLLSEAFLLYVTPQLDALDYEGIREIYARIADFFNVDMNDIGMTILTRIRLLYPHIPEAEWKDARQKWQEPSANRVGE